MISNGIAKVVHTIQNIRALAQHHYGGGALGVLRMAYVSLFRANTFVLFERILDDFVEPVYLGPEYTVIKPSRAQLDEIRSGRELPREFYYDQIHGVHNCYLVLCGERPAYIHWVYVAGDPNRFLRLPVDIAEMNYNTTLPEFRGKKLMSQVMRYMMYDLKQRGFRKVVGVVHLGNPAALRNMELAQFKEVRRIRTLGYLNRKYDVA